MKVFRLFIALGFAVTAPAGAQQASDRVPLTQHDYEGWRSIQGAVIANDGSWILYTLAPQVGDGELIVRATDGSAEYRAPRGFVSRPSGLPQPGGGPATPPASGAESHQFTADSRFVVFMAQPDREEVERARRERRRGARQPQGHVGVMNLATGEVTTIPQARSYRLASESGRFLFYQTERDTTSRDSTAADRPGPAAAATPGGEARPVARDTTGDRPRKKEYGARLVIRELATGEETAVEDVLSFAVEDSGRHVAYIVSSRDSTRDGVFIRTMATGAVQAVLAGEARHRLLTFDAAGTQVAFVSDRAEKDAEQPRFSVYHATVRSPRARIIVAADMPQDSLRVAERGRLAFTRSGAALVVPLLPAPMDSIPADSLADKAVFDLWHYRDLRLQPQQAVEARRDRSRAYTAVYHMGNRRLVRLTNDTILDVSLSDDGRVAVGSTSVPYAIQAMWGEGGQDIWAIDGRTGERNRVVERNRTGGTLSPEGRFILFFRDGGWHAYSTADRRTASLTARLDGVRFDQETWDTPSEPLPYGVAGWTNGDRSVLVYDRYDLWELDPTGSRAPRMVTDSAGRRQSIELRLVRLDREERTIDPARPLLLRASNEETMATGFWRDQLGATRPPEMILMEDRNYGVPQRARDASMFMVTRSTYTEYPDLWVGAELTTLSRASDANPQQARYRWGSVELIDWLSADGIPLKGLLFRPDDFDSDRQYPMIVYFYEQLSQGLHQYRTPAGRNVVNPTVYASNGYVVFLPDIAYQEGYPGPSALKSIVPGVQSILSRGFVDPRRIGIAGQSWGGYQAAYIITQSNMFSAAMAGAPVANMTSAYGGIRWQSGLARAFQYERTQSRIGGSLWEHPLRYIENSPLFHADRIQTPLLIMHNDEDGAVPWYQGIEMFVAMRRLGKEVYLINYNGDGHNPMKRANQLDIDMRMQQFFAHHLKGEPMPSWMERGIPFLEKGRDQLVTQEPPVASTVESSSP